MNIAEQRRNDRITAMSDRQLLKCVVAGGHAEDVSRVELNAFIDMLARVDEGGTLSKRERAWAEDAARRIVPILASEVPTGRPVATPAVLQTLPKAPPGRAQ